jgi:hypothetical protein
MIFSCPFDWLGRMTKHVATRLTVCKLDIRNILKPRLLPISENRVDYLNCSTLVILLANQNTLDVILNYFENVQVILTKTCCGSAQDFWDNNLYR